jgi:uncharacterized paraquat-inducible protein A
MGCEPTGVLLNNVVGQVQVTPRPSQAQRATIDSNHMLLCNKTEVVVHMFTVGREFTAGRPRCHGSINPSWFRFPREFCAGEYSGG